MRVHKIVHSLKFKFLTKKTRDTWFMSFHFKAHSILFDITNYMYSFIYQDVYLCLNICMSVFMYVYIHLLMYLCIYLSGYV